MIILEGILGEEELLFFTEETYKCFTKLLNKYIAFKLEDYMNNPEANPILVEQLRENMGDAIALICNNKKFQEPKLRALIFNMQTYDPYDPDNNNSEIKQTLLQIDEILATCRLTISPRNKKDYEEFLCQMRNIIAIQYQTGMESSIPNLMDSILANSQVLYNRFETETPLEAMSVSKYRDTWYSAKCGIEWSDYTANNKLNYKERTRI